MSTERWAPRPASGSSRVRICSQQPVLCPAGFRPKPSGSESPWPGLLHRCPPAVLPHSLQAGGETARGPSGPGRGNGSATRHAWNPVPPSLTVRTAWVNHCVCGLVPRWGVRHQYPQGPQPLRARPADPSIRYAKPQVPGPRPVEDTTRELRVCRTRGACRRDTPGAPGTQAAWGPGHLGGAPSAGSRRVSSHRLEGGRHL